MRTAEIKRRTAETDIYVKLVLDGTGQADIDTGVGFFNHMLTLFAKHGNFDLTVHCKGDTDVDAHHTVEDTALCLGQAFRSASGECRGICRYGDILLPMDEALLLAAVDFGGRAYLNYQVEIKAGRVGTFDTELLEEFMQAFVRTAQINLHLKKLEGRNAHHILEGTFKALARALRKALTADAAIGDALPTTKGVF